MKSKVTRTVQVQCLRDWALFTVQYFRITTTEPRGLSAHFLIFLTKEVDERADESGEEIAANKGRDGVRSDITTGKWALTNRRWKRVPSSRS